MADAVTCPDVATAAWDGADWRRLPVIAASGDRNGSCTAGPCRPRAGTLLTVAGTESQPRVVAELAEIAHESAARLTVISSDVVFAGPRMFHEETFTAGDTTPRAVLTRNMEQALEGSGTLVVRTHAFGWSPVAAHAGYAEQAAQALVDGSAPWPTAGATPRRY